MQEALQVLEAYERTFFTGLPEVNQDINMEKSKKAIGVVSDFFKNSGEMRKLAAEFIEVLNVQEHEQEDIFEEVERYRIEASNRYERHDFLGQVGIEADGKEVSLKFPRATKSTLKFWLYSNAENPYPTEAEKEYLCELTNLTRAQLNQWFINGRRRILNNPSIKREYLGVKSEVEYAKPSPVITKQKPEGSKSVSTPQPTATRYSLRPREMIPKTEKISEIYETARSAHSDEYEESHSDEEPSGRRRKRNKRKSAYY